MGRKSRDKGYRTEAGIVQAMQNAGFAAQRIPLSGAAGGKFSGDVTMPLLGADKVFEVKCRATGFAQLYGWLAEHDGLIVKADRKQPLMVLPLDAFLRLCRVAETVKTSSIYADAFWGTPVNFPDNGASHANESKHSGDQELGVGVDIDTPEEAA